MTETTDPGTVRTTYGDQEHLVAEVSDGVGVLTLNRPRSLNAVTEDMGADLMAVLDAWERDDTVRVIVVTGAGGNFCSGVDVAGGTTFERIGEARKAGVGGHNYTTFRPWARTTPVVGAIEGNCVGLGASLSLLFDVRFAGQNARFGFLFPRLGLGPELGISWLLPRVVGVSRAADILLSGRFVPAAEAASIGLTSATTPQGEALETALAWARELTARTSPVAVASAKRLMWQHLGESDPDRALVSEKVIAPHLLTGPDNKAVVQALREKTGTPTWRSSKHDEVGLGRLRPQGAA